MLECLLVVGAQAKVAIAWQIEEDGLLIVQTPAQTVTQTVVHKASFE